MNRHIRIRWALPALLFTFAAACEDTLSVEPVNEVPAETAINDLATATAALAGAYDALQDDGGADYLSGSFTVFNDLPSDDVVHTGTFDTFLEADLNDLLADNGTIQDIWDILYEGISRVNRLIEQVPPLNNVSQEDKDNILGQARFLRALHYHNLVKLWGDVPLRLTTPASPEEAGLIARSSEAEVYSQILSDLAQSRTMVAEEAHPTIASVAAVHALRTRVMLFQGNWAGVIANADSLEALGQHELEPDFASLFTPTTTSEDVLRVNYTPEEAHLLGWWYRSKGDFGGRYEVAPSCALAQEFDADVNCTALAPYATYNPADQRGQVTIQKNGNAEIFGGKWPTGIGDEGIHVIRYAEVILNKAEALARENRLAEAVDEYNRTRVRAGLGAHLLGVTDIDPGVGLNLLNTQEEVLGQIWAERRLELAMEGFRFPDLVRTGRAVAVLGIEDRPHQVLFPIPQQELDVAPNLTQNPGY
ncbi:MAG: RagB/SusD family nutrient uptake outer membrane protein [Gemmatimonadaceae bacterium]